MHDDISDNAMETLSIEYKVSKIYKGIYTHLVLLLFFMSLSLCECKGYGFLKTKGQSWKGIRHNLVQSLHF